MATVSQISNSAMDLLLCPGTQTEKSAPMLTSLVCLLTEVVVCVCAMEPELMENMVGIVAASV